MRKILTFISLFLIIGCAPKISNSDINSDLTSYINFIQKGDYENAILYMPTDFWNYYNKEKYLKGLKEITNEMGYISAGIPEIKGVSELKKIENNYFKVIKYKIELSFDSSKISNKLIEKYKSQYGAKSLKIDTIRNRIEIINQNAMITVFDKVEKEWRFLELNPHIITKIYGYETWIELH